MKLHIDLVKDILLQVEKCEERNFEDIPSTQKYDIDTVMYHCILLEEAGYLKLDWMDLMDVDDKEDKVTGTTFLVERLTLQGHNLATLMQTESWSSFVEGARASGLDFPLNFIEQVIISHLKGRSFI